jgi:hypothetical protein
MTTELQIKKEGAFSLAPRNLEEALRFAEILAKSSMVPKNYQGRPGDILVAVQMGAEIGLKPLQALQNIATINGKPSVYGDAAMALVKAHPTCDDIIETFDQAKMEATCIAKRKGKADVVCVFNKDKAVKAALWGKSGPWAQYPERMLQMRARSYALRDQFPDVLQGLILAEEAQDYVDVTPTASNATYTATIEVPTQAMPDLSDKPIVIHNNWTDKSMPIMPAVLGQWLEAKLKQIHTKNELATMESFLQENAKELSKWKHTKLYQAEATAFGSALATKRKEFVDQDKLEAEENEQLLAERKEKYAEEPELDCEMPGDSEYQEAIRC